MIVLASVLLLAAAADGNRLDFQMMTSPSYESFARKAEAACPARKLRYLHPADLDAIEEDFLSALPRRDRHRVARADAGSKGCAPAGMSCPAQHTLGAIVGTGLLDRFVHRACSGSY